MSMKHYSEDAPAVLSDVLLVELDSRWSRKKITLAPLVTALPVGAVLAVNAAGKHVPYLAGAEDVAAVAVLITPASASEAEQSAVAVVRGAVVAAANLHFLPAVTAEQKQTALAALDSLGVTAEE